MAVSTKQLSVLFVYYNYLYRVTLDSLRPVIHIQDILKELKILMLIATAGVNMLVGRKVHALPPVQQLLLPSLFLDDSRESSTQAKNED